MDTEKTSKRPDESVVMLALLLAVITFAVVTYGCWWLGDQLQGVHQHLPGNPVAGYAALVKGTLRWPPAATVLTFTTWTATAAFAAWAGTAWRTWTRSPVRRLDRAAARMASSSQLSEVTGREALEKARRLNPGVEITRPEQSGLLVGHNVKDGAAVYFGHEDVGVCFAGPRTGKTAALAIPAVCQATGPVIATSNKRDLRDHTRGVRETDGRRVWESDLQGICGTPNQDWWWNPLDGIAGLGAARTLAGHFASAEKDDNAKTDAYFDGGSTDLVALYFWAAAGAGGDLVHALAWMSDPDDATAYGLLVKAGDTLSATKLATAMALNPRQRDGLYDIGRRNLNVLTDPIAAASAVPPVRKSFPGDTTDLASWSSGARHNLPEFRPAEFVVSRDTLFALSMEGPASATGLMTALVGRILDEALAVARRNRGGRLPVTMTAVLDEAANVCRLKDLPALYSHLGSQGVNVLTFLQSPAQAAKVWDPTQLKQLAEQCNLHYYGGGIRDRDYLTDLSAFCDDYDVARWSRQTGPGGSTASQSWSREPILSIAALAQLPKSRAVVLTSGNPAVVVRKTYWADGPHAEAIRASLAKYGPDQPDTDTTPESGRELEKQ